MTPAHYPNHAVRRLAAGLRLALVMALACPAIRAGAQTPPTPPPTTEDPPAPPDGDLAEKLTRRATDASEEDIMAELIRLMSEASRRLDVEFDAGDETQAVQATILRRLDDAIQQAAAQRKLQQSSSRQPSGDRRTAPDQPTDPQAKPGADPADAAAGDPARTTEAPAGGAASTERTTGGDLRETRSAWGNLPPRERDEVIQGSREQFLDRYRHMIERYFRALQEGETEP
jgi:hypothetical protein